MHRWIPSLMSARTGLQLVLWSPMLISCGGRLQTDSTAESKSAITSATFTLTAPKGMSVLAPALEAASSLSLRPFAKVMPSAPVVAMGSSASTVAEPDVQFNDLWSRGPVTLKERAVVLGIVHAKYLTLQNLTLPASKKDSAPVIDPVSSLSWTVTYPTATPTAVVLNAPEKKRIEPGVYDSITLNSPQGGEPAPELTFTSGTYYVGTLILQSGGKVWLDQAKGPVIIYASTIYGLRSDVATLDGLLPDLFLGYLGTDSLYVEAKFIGALVAPNASVTLRAVAGGHTGFFAGHEIVLDANAVVNYRAPNMIPAVAEVPQASCKDLVQLRWDLGGDAQQMAYYDDLARYCGLCLSPLDSDLDGTRDCIDGCPYDPTKTAPGISGCGHTDTPKIPGGLVAGLTQCPYDPENVKPGDCGCIGEGSLQPANTPCYDPDCPNQPSPVCDGLGQCGSRGCVPDGCRPITVLGVTYFLCGGSPIPPASQVPPKTQQGAYDSCNAKGLTMARVDTYAQNEQIKELLKALGIPLAWLGGNQITTSGSWRWAKLGSFDGDQFWSGGASGSAVNGKFAAWAQGSPTTDQCLAMRASDGRWVATGCNQPLPYVCENVPQETTSAGASGSSSGNPAIPKQPAPLSSCVPSGGGPAPLPPNVDGGMDQLLLEHALVEQGIFTGAAAVPPTGTSTCPGGGLTRNCPLTNVQPLPCDDPATTEVECDCATENARRRSDDTDICEVQFGAGYVCLARKIDPTCVAEDAGAPDCPMKAECGIPDCSNENPQYSLCDEVNICPNPEDEYIFTELDTGHTLTADPITPATFIQGTPVTSESLRYEDTPPSGPSGKDHIWCQLNVQDTNNVRPVHSVTDKSGSSGGTSPINVKFNPNLVFDAEVKPLAFGQTDMHLLVKAFMSAEVSLKKAPLAPKEGITTQIFTAGVEATADRCRVTTGSEFSVFGVPISLDRWIKRIDTNTDPATASTAQLCQHSVADFIVKADRLKKAFRDAQQLLYQYKTLKTAGKSFGSNLCSDLGIPSLANRNFPMAGLCPEGEPPELTINRFVDFYQSENRGELAALKNATSYLSEQTKALIQDFRTGLGVNTEADFTVRFANFKRSETKTIAKMWYTIGPVPMLLEIAVVAAYGINGEFDLNLDFPTDIFNPIGDIGTPGAPKPAPIAGVKTIVEPWASAGMTVFAGANFGIGSVGIEGGITLAKVSAPIVAGLGLAIASTDDTRQVPPDIASVSSLVGATPNFVFGKPKSYQFYLTYDLGASVNLAEVLSGELNGRLTIDFWFFSRTWRQRIVKFTGWSRFYPLILQSGTYAPVNVPGGGTINGANALAAIGRAELPLPFTYLEPLSLPDTPDETIDYYGDGAGGAGGAGGASGTGGAPTTAPVDTSLIEQFSYDNLCCSGKGQDCAIAGRPSCCTPLQCIGASEASMGQCGDKSAPACAPPGADCGRDFTTGDSITCCSGAVCPINGRCPALSCQPEYGPCTSPLECCPPYPPAVAVCALHTDGVMRCASLEIE